MPQHRRLAIAVALAMSTTAGVAQTPANAPSAEAQPQSPSAGEIRARLEHGVRAYEAGRPAEARRTFEQLSELGAPAAHHNLAVMHLRGDAPGGVLVALQLLERAADSGFVTSMVLLAQLHEEGSASGQPDLAAAHRWYLRAAGAGSRDAQVEAATGYYLGRGTARDLPQAVHWYREAAKGGDVGAMYLLASMYETGLGVSCDLRLALFWYAAAAEAGDAAAALKVIELRRKLEALPC